MEPPSSTLTSARHPTRPVPGPPPSAVPPPAPAPALPRAVALATALALALRLFRIGHPSLWIDEVFTWLSAAIHQPYGWRDVLSDLHGPLYSALLHAWGAVAGDSEWALRLPSAVFGALAVPGFAWLAARWLGDDAAAPAAWLAAGSPFLVWYGQEARNYAMLIACVVFSAALLLERARAGAPATAGWIAASLAGMTSNLTFAFVLPVELRWALAGAARGESRRRAWGAAAALALVALVALAWIPQATHTLDFRRLHFGGPNGTAPLRSAGSFHPAAVPFGLHAFAVGYTLGPSLRELRAAPGPAALRAHRVELAVTVALFGWLGIAGLKTVARRRRIGDLLVWAGVPLLLVSWFAFENFKVFHPRYLAACFPAFLLVIAAAFAGMPRGARRVAAVALALVWGASLWNLYFVPGYGKEDMRGATRYVETHARPGEVLVAAGTEDLLGYYHHGPQRVAPVWLGWSADPARLKAHVRETLDGSPGAWVMLARPEDLDPRGVFARLLDAGPDPRWAVESAPRFEGVRVWHLVPAAAARPVGRAHLAVPPALRAASARDAGRGARAREAEARS
jgi:mannosyltransferase